MTPPIEHLTPRQIVQELDRYIIGQDAAKRAVAVALRNRYRRQQLPEHQRDDIMPKNILMMGPTGVGKTEIARRLASLTRAPFVKVEATKFTEVGYVGRDVESMVRELVAASVRLIQTEVSQANHEESERRAFDRIVEMVEYKLFPPNYYRNEPIFAEELDEFGNSQIVQQTTEPEIDEDARRDQISQQIKNGEHDDLILEIDVEESSNPFVQVFSPQGIEEMGFDMNSLTNPFGSKHITRKVTVREAMSILVEDEAQKMTDKAGLHRDAIDRAEQLGIIFIDEIDKVAIKSSGSGPDVSREGVQRDLLPVIEGSTVQTKFGPIRTDHILFIAAGAFHMSKPSDLIPELQGRLPIRVELEALSNSDFGRILREPENALTKQYQLLLKTEGITLQFSEDAIDEIASMASEVNAQTENIGARRLHTMMEKLLEEILFAAPDVPEKEITISKQQVRERLLPLVKNIEKSRNIL